ncbi:hypothetical protein ACQ4PT_009140 [Festuca glaucescens]
MKFVCLFQVIHDQDASGDKGNADSELPASIGVQQEVSQADDVKIFTENVAEEITVVPEPAPENECVTATEAIPDSSGMQIVGDIGGNWKAIMHEQSNQYYYWNTITGETSWEIPNALASGVSADGVTSASMPTHMEYSVEAEAHVLPHSNGEAYPNDVSVGNGTATYSSMGMVCGSGELTHNAYAYTGAVASHESVNIDPLQLAKFGEDLLQRLKLLERPHVAIDSIELIKREIEMRISDCNALSSYGPSLLPLWLHAEVHLKHLELSVSKFEASYTTKPGYLETADAEYKAPNEAEVMADENAKVEEPCSTSLVQNPQEGAAAVVSKVESESDEDMDVEMEVDEESVEEQGGPASVPNEEHPSSEQVRSPTLPSLDDSAPPPQDDGIPPPPPPPEEEWIPPPPPENEQAPPPPPEPEEAVVSYAQADTLPQPYVDQANLGYMLPGVEYYPAVGSDGTIANYYMQVSESHILQSQQHSYYAPVSASSIPIPVDATSVPPVPGSYYGYPSVTMAATEVAAESSGYYASSTSAISSGALDDKTSSASVVDTNSNVNPMESDKVISKEPTIAPLGQSVGAASASGTTVHGGSTQASASTTNQTKVPRTKKRPVAVASSLRSNKKVSSLVDKWKAAKEELRGEEEEEPEDALEAFERKRWKEIDGWRKQQIASGEAKENANFVPLGGDWRDRVKRKRKEAKKESKAESVAAAEQHKGQPDLTELSKGLPSGWQAYIDESTKQVYYGNSLTSETSWDRPGK